MRGYPRAFILPLMTHTTKNTLKLLVAVLLVVCAAAWPFVKPLLLQRLAQ